MSELSFGSWVTYGNQMDDSLARECMAAAYDAGVNFFDNAEVYAKGESESIMGEVLKELGWRRASYIVSTKFYWGLDDGPNEKNTLNRKYLMQAIDGSLARLQLDYVDLVFCHRPDPDTPIEETVLRDARHDRARQGAVLGHVRVERGARSPPRGTSPTRHHLHKPVMEQPQYNLLHRERVEQRIRARSTTTSGSAPRSGARSRRALLTGKYNDGVPPGSRAHAEGLRVAERARARRRTSSRRCASSCRSPQELGLHAGAACARLVPQEPACLAR